MANVVLDAGHLSAQTRLQASRTELAALEWLTMHNTLRVGDIAGELAISTGTASGVVDRLVARGYANRVADPQDGRGTLVVLTPKGKREFRSAFRERWRWINAVAAELSPDELDVVVRFLRRMHELMPEEWRPRPRGPSSP